jgi:predicted transcriptional regulator
MKATIEIPDELYRRVKAKSAMQGRTIREVTIQLYQHWLAEDQAGRTTATPDQWLDEWIRLGEEALRDAPPGPTAREILEADRARLDRG